MLDFFSGVIALFNMTFSAALELDFFQFLSCCILVEVAAGLFFLLYRGTRRM